MELKGYGEGKTVRRCPVCGSKDGRVGMGKDDEGNWKRGWLCFACGYFPGKSRERCLIDRVVSEMERIGKVSFG